MSSPLAAAVAMAVASLVGPPPAFAQYVRYLWDSAAKTPFEGGTLWMSFTLARLRQ
jgi:hypothetical protein